MNSLESLNESQRRAVTAVDGPVLVIAGPGTGKTSTIVHRIAYMIRQGIPPERILSVTFTNRAAGEMRQRAASLLGGDQEGIFIGTFHHLGIRILRDVLPGRFTLYNRDDQAALLREILGEGTSRASCRRIAERISRIKNLVEEVEDETEGIYRDYQAALRNNGALDFDDLILRPVEILGDGEWRERYRSIFRYIIVDEYQDINPAQYRLLTLLAGRKGNICAVGDPDQAIYSFRGADLGNFLNFEDDFEGAERIVLRENYRSTATVLNAADRVISRNRRRIIKELSPVREKGRPLKIVSVPDGKAEGEFIVREIEKRVGGTSHSKMHGSRAFYDLPEHPRGFSDFAVIFRTNAQAKVIEEAFLSAGIPCQVIGGRGLLKGKGVEEVLACLKVLINPGDDLNLRRLASMPRRGLSRAALSEAAARAAEEGVSLFDAVRESARRWGEKDREFPSMIERLLDLKERLPLRELLSAVLDETGLGECLDVADGDFMLLEDLAGAYQGMEPGEALAGFVQEAGLLTPAEAFDPRAHAVTLMTMHMAKGLEFRVVFIAGLEDGLTPYSLCKDGVDIEEERRLFYVAVTRAMDELFLVHARERVLYGRKVSPAPSPFLGEIPPELTTTVTIPDRPRARKGDGQVGLF